jgi:hypothetical protein
MRVLACGAAVADHPFPGKVLSRPRGARSKRALGMEASGQARWFERLSSEPRNATLIRRGGP